ncbi:MAG: DUF222 domain-containing protein [Microthrixaceae bacterium]
MAADVADVLARAGAVLAELREVDLDGLGDDTLSEAVLAMQRLRGGLDVAEARVLARWDAQGAWRASGAKTGAAWLAWRQHVPIQTARQRVRHARALRTLPEVEAAWAQGAIDRAHVTTLLGARTPRTAEVFDREHKTLLDIARDSWFGHFKRACDRFEMAVDPDGAEQGADADRDARALHLSQSFGSMWFGKMTFDPISGEIVDTTLRPIERELFEADWAAAKARLGRDPMITELDRTPAQRRADALVEMAIRARTAPVGGRRPAPLFTVVVGLDTLTGPILELFNRTPITPGTAARHLTEADVERIVFDSPSRVIDVGVRRRFFTGALRRAIEVRDRTCFHPSCDEVPERLQIDHIHDASKGGETTQVNAQGGCGFHNRWKYNHPGSSDADPDADPSPPLG